MTTTATSPDLAAAHADRLAGEDYQTLADRYGFASYDSAYSAIVRYGARIGRPVPVPLRNRRFGVEIECLIPVRDAEQALRDAGVNSSGWRGYTHDGTDTWKVVSDGSLSSGGCEVVSPILRGRQGAQELRKVMKALRALGARVDRSCGMHVHHEVDDFTGEAIARLVENYAVLQGSIDSLLPASRRNGRWCASLANDEVRRIADIFRSHKDSIRSGMTYLGFDRYKTINVTSFPKYGTVEFRQHQGTLNGAKATAWIDLGLTMVAAAAAGHVSQPGDDVLDLMRSYGYGPSADYLGERRSALA